MNDSGSLAKNSIFFALYRLINVIFPLITIAYVSRIIFPDGVGRVASSQNIAQYFAIFASLGIPNYGIREAARCRDNLEDKSKLFSELFLINFISTSLAVVAYLILINNLTTAKNDYQLYLIAGIMIIINYFNVDWYYQGTEKYNFIVIRNFAIKLLSLACILLFVKTKEDYIVYALIYAGGYAGNNIINFIHLRADKIRFVVNEIDIKHHFKPVIVLLCTAIAIELYTMVDMTMLTFMGTSSVVGYYTNSVRTVKVVISLVTAISAVLLPRLSYYYANKDIKACEDTVNKVLNILIFLLVPCFVGILCTSESIVNVFFGSSFAQAVPTMRILSFLILVLGLSNLFGTQILLTFNDEKKLLISTIVGATINILLNAFLIPMYMQNGAALASVISELAVTLFTYKFASKHLRITVDKRSLVKTIIAGLLIAIVVTGLNQIPVTFFIKLVIQVISGVIVYVAFNYCLRNQSLVDLLSIGRKRNANRK